LGAGFPQVGHFGLGFEVIIAGSCHHELLGDTLALPSLSGQLALDFYLIEVKLLQTAGFLPILLFFKDLFLIFSLQPSPEFVY
jgi:hypothetical protein